MTLADLRRALDTAMVALPTDDICDAIGACAATQARLTARLVAPSPTPATADQLVDADQLAEHFGVPVSQIYQLSRQRRLPCVHLGKYVRFSLAAVQQALATEPGSKLDQHQPPKRRSNGKASQAAATTVLPAIGRQQAAQTAPEPGNG